MKQGSVKTHWLAVFALATNACHAAAPPPAEPVSVVAVLATPPSPVPSTQPAREEAALDLKPIPVLYGLFPGMSLDQIRERLGTESSSQNYDGAVRMWEIAGHDIRRELPFLLGFDTVVLFNDGQADPNRPVWHIYLKDGKLVQAKGAIYPTATEDDVKRSFGFPPSCYINGDPKGIRETFGPDDAVWIDEQNRTFHFFLRRGVAAMEEAGHIQVLDIFTPLPADRAREVADVLSRR